MRDRSLSAWKRRQARADRLSRRLGGLAVAVGLVWVAGWAGFLDGVPWPERAVYGVSAEDFLACFEPRARLMKKDRVSFVRRHVAEDGRVTLIRLEGIVGLSSARQVTISPVGDGIAFADSHYGTREPEYSKPLSKHDWFVAWGCGTGRLRA